MSLIKTDNGRILLKKAESMMLVPYVYDENVGDYVLGENVYDISAIIGDSVTLEQSDGESVTKNNEFVSSPLLEMFSGGKYGFSAQCLDLQNAVVRTLFGAMTGSGKNAAVAGAVAFHDDFVLRYALIKMRFKDTAMPDVILPKVLLNSRLLISQLKTRAAQGNLAGTSLSRKVGIKDKDSAQNLLQFSSPSDGASTYTPYTPVMFVPRGYTPVFFHHEDGDDEIYTEIDFSTGSVSNNVVVDPTTGYWTEGQSQEQNPNAGSGSGSGSENNQS